MLREKGVNIWTLRRRKEINTAIKCSVFPKQILLQYYQRQAQEIVQNRKACGRRKGKKQINKYDGRK